MTDQDIYDEFSYGDEFEIYDEFSYNDGAEDIYEVPDEPRPEPQRSYGDSLPPPLPPSRYPEMDETYEDFSENQQHAVMDETYEEFNDDQQPAVMEETYEEFNDNQQDSIQQIPPPRPGPAPPTREKMALPGMVKPGMLKPAMLKPTKKWQTPTKEEFNEDRKGSWKPPPLPPTPSSGPTPAPPIRDKNFPSKSMLKPTKKTPAKEEFEEDRKSSWKPLPLPPTPSPGPTPAPPMREKNFPSLSMLKPTKKAMPALPKKSADMEAERPRNKPSPFPKPTANLKEINAIRKKLKKVPSESFLTPPATAPATEFPNPPEFRNSLDMEQLKKRVPNIFGERENLNNNKYMKPPPQEIPVPVEPANDYPDDGGWPDEELYADTCDPKILLQQKPWYFGVLGRMKEEELLRGINKDGAFLLRDSSGNNPAQLYTLTVLFKTRLFRLKVRQLPNGEYAVGEAKPDEVKFCSIESVISHYQSTPLILIAGNKNDNNGQTLLKHIPSQLG